MEFQNAGMMQDLNNGNEDNDDGVELAFDEQDDDDQNTKQPQQQPLENIFLASGFRRGMRQIAKELARSGGDTDLASLVEGGQIQGNNTNKDQRCSNSGSNSNQEIIVIGRSVGTVHKKELLKNIGELDDDFDQGDGEASGLSSKQMILGSDDTSMLFDKPLDESSNGYSPFS